VQHELGTKGGAYDLNAACSGFVYGLVTADAMVRAGSERVLLIGSETMSRMIDWEDRSTAVLFGDGAGAVVIEPTDAPGLLGFDLGSDGSLRSILDADIGGYLRMQGKEVFRRAVRVMIDSANLAMERAGVQATDIALVVPHQANIRIIESANAKLGIPMERTALVLEHTGNTSSASIPIALAEAADAGRIHDGDLVLMTGFGAGMSWASAVVRWG
jgi:3-oxoacyl-[acyl-carrier-protein] synthase-3